MGRISLSDTMLPIERVRHRRKVTGGTHYTPPRQPLMKIFEHKSPGGLVAARQQFSDNKFGPPRGRRECGELRTERFAGATETLGKRV